MVSLLEKLKGIMVLDIKPREEATDKKEIFVK